MSKNLYPALIASLLALCIFALGVLIPPSARAMELKKGQHWISPSIGAVKPSAENYKWDGTAGLRFGKQLTDLIGLDLFGEYSQQVVDSGEPGKNADITLIPVGVEPILFLDYRESLKGIFNVGLKIGATIQTGKVRIGSTETDLTETEFTVGIRAGYDYEVSDNVTIGPEASIVQVMALNEFSLFGIYGAAKFWF
jgi:hypothetical protein